jgi:hypothetical protein
MPGGVPVRSVVAPEIAVPAQPIDWLPADAAMARPSREGGLPIGSWRHAEGHRQTSLLVRSETPLPPCGLSAFGRQRPRQPVSQERPMPPVRFHGSPLGPRDQWLPECMGQNAGGKGRGKAPLEPSSRLLVLLVSPSRYPGSARSRQLPSGLYRQCPSR